MATTGTSHFEHGHCYTGYCAEAERNRLLAALKQLVAGVTVTDCYKHIPDAYLKEARQAVAECDWERD